MVFTARAPPALRKRTGITSKRIGVRDCHGPSVSRVLRTVDLISLQRGNHDRVTKDRKKWVPCTCREKMVPPESVAAPPVPPGVCTAAAPAPLRWWLKLMKPALPGLWHTVDYRVGFGPAFGWISSESNSRQDPVTTAKGESVRYICPMMCTPPQTEPGRCPVCAMELVPASSDSGTTVTSVRSRSTRPLAGLPTSARCR